MQHVNVRPVIELETKTVVPPPDTRSGRLAVAIQKLAAFSGYLETPDGWFVPIATLRGQKEAVADYLHSVTLYYNEFEINGGFEILVKDFSTVH